MPDPVTCHLFVGPADHEVLELDHAPTRILWETPQGVQHVYQAVQADQEARIVGYWWRGPVEPDRPADSD